MLNEECAFTESEINQQITQYDRFIHKMIRQMVHDYDSSDVCMEYDDLLQRGRMYVLEALKQYDGERGMKVSSFVCLKLWTKFANFGRQFKNANKKKTIRMSRVGNSDTVLYGSNFDSDESPTLSSFSTVLDGVSGVEDQMIRRLDAEKFISKLSGDNELIFREHFIEGRSAKEIDARYPKFGIQKIKSALRTLYIVTQYGEVNLR